MDPYNHPPSMTLSPQSQAQSPTATPQPSVFRPRRSEDWHEYREIIEQLYRSDQLKLRDVKRIMEREYKFYASEKQYKDRLAAWNVRKNIKAAEVQVMIRKKQKRAARGKQTAFRRSGQNVDPKRITRFVRRYGSTWVKNRDKDAELQSPEPSTPSDMSCYTPEPEDDVATPVSPPDLQSPTRETPYPMGYDQNHIDSIPDLVMDDEHAFPMAMHNHQRRVYHPSDPVAHSIAHQGVHVTHPGMHLATHPSVHPTVHAPVPPPMHRAVHPPPMLHTTLHQPLHSSVHSVHPSVRSSGHPVVTQIPAPAPISSHHHHHHHDDVDAPGEVTHPDDWNRLDVFQNRLNRLGSTLEESMAKWSSRDQDPNQEVPHHEGLGL